MEKIVRLNWKDLTLGELYTDERKYIFIPNYNSLDSAREKGCPVELVYYKNDEKYISDEIFHFFSDFIFEDTRDDLWEYTKLYKIEGKNKEIIKLKTVAKISQDKNRFWIE